MRHIKRHVVLAVCLSLVSSVWSSPAQTEPMRFWPFGTTEATSLDDAAVNDDAEKEGELRGQSIKFGAVEPLSAYVNTNTIVLRESAEANAPIIARVDVGDFEAAVILDTKSGFVHVRLETNQDAVADVPRREREYEGWTTWDSIVPDITAMVLNAETGEVVARVPLPDGVSSVVFSPDGSKAMFFSTGIGSVAREVRTSDYTFTRTLASSADEQFGSLFYGPADGSLYASTYQSSTTLIRIGSDGQPNTPLDLEADIKVSPDGHLGFVSHGQSGEELTVDVIDMATLGIRNTLVISAAGLSTDASSFVVNKEGSELYIRSTESLGPISVIDTLTGQVVRELSDPTGGTYFSQGDLVGDSLLMRVWTESEDEMPVSSKNYWISSGRRMLAQPGIDFAVEAGDSRFAINDEGTFLLKLDNNNRIQERFKIDRPERGTDRHAGNGLTVFGLSASPDGKQIIVFLGTPHGC